MKTQARTAQVVGIVTQTSPYCGGARPSDEVLQETNRPRPYPGKTLILQKENSPSQESIKTVTNDSGWFFVSVPSGEYLLWQEEQLQPQPPAAFRKIGLVMVDSLCLERWKTQPLARLKVTNGSADTAKLNFHHPCFISGDVPCRRYVGPMPP